MHLMRKQLIAMMVLTFFALIALAVPAHAQAELDSKDEPSDQPAAEQKTDESEADTAAIEPAYGMTLADADTMLADKERWQVAYRIVTPSTAEISCRLDNSADFTLRFYHGECCYIEKIGIVDEAELKKVFDYYAAQLGTTEEATESSDKTHVFSRWKERDREVELSASRIGGGSKRYELTYLELDIKIDRLARQAQESEIEALAETAATSPEAAPAP
jgi:hypothetical protein